MKNTLTAQDIMHAEFKKAMRGYDTQQVDSFLDEVAETLQRVAERMVQLEQTIIKDKEKLAEYEKTQELMQSTLLMAQKSAEARVEHAREEAKEIVAAAQEEARNITNSAFEAKSKFDGQLGQIEQIRDGFVTEAREMLERFGKLLDEAAEQHKSNYQLPNSNDQFENEELRMKNDESEKPLALEEEEKTNPLLSVEIEDTKENAEDFASNVSDSSHDNSTFNTQHSTSELTLSDSEEQAKQDCETEEKEPTEEEKEAQDLAEAEQESYANEDQSSLFGAFEQPRTATKKINYADTDNLDD